MVSQRRHHTRGEVPAQLYVVDGMPVPARIVHGGVAGELGDEGWLDWGVYQRSPRSPG